MRVGIFGGAFDPPHRGHERALSAFLREAKLDLCYCVPTGIPPHKQMSGGATAQHRLEMARLAFMPSSERIRIWEGELQRKGPSYSYMTVEDIAQRHPEDQLFLFVGTDQFLVFETWKEARQILSRVVLCVMERYGEDPRGLFDKKAELEKEFGATCLLLQEKAYIISSSQIREEIRKNGFSLALSPAVNEWITKKRLYGKGDPLRTRALELVEGALSPKRLSHTLAVEQEVARLCELFAYPRKKELCLAALFHDRTKEWSEKEHLAFLKARGEAVSSEDRESPAVLHGATAAILAEEELGLSLEETLAIACHTTGKPGMTLGEKILCFADFIEETRIYHACRQIRDRFYNNLPESREERISHLDACLLASLEHTLERLKKEEQPIHPLTLLAAADLKQERKCHDSH